MRSNYSPASPAQKALALKTVFKPSMAKTKASSCRPEQGGAASRTSSPASGVASPKNVVGSFPMSEVPFEWDNTPEIRDRIRKNMNLCLRYNDKMEPECGYIEPTLDHLKLNRCVLRPVAVLMAQNDLQLPSIEALLSAVAAFYDICKLPRVQEQIYQEGWAIRRMIVKAKKWLYRAFAPQDCDSNHHVIFFLKKYIFFIPQKIGR